MNKNFLNSFAFEQMVREYNKKYSGGFVNVLQINKGEELLLKVENIFNKVFRLFYLLDKNFKGKIYLNEFFKIKESFIANLKRDFKNCFSKDFIPDFNFQTDSKLNHKICVNLMLEIFKDILHINSCYINSGLKESIYNNFCGDDVTNEFKWKNDKLEEKGDSKIFNNQNKYGGKDNKFYLIEEHSAIKILNELFDELMEVFSSFYKNI